MSTIRRVQKRAELKISDQINCHSNFSIHETSAKPNKNKKNYKNKNHSSSNMTSQMILGFKAIVLTTTILSGRCQSKPLQTVQPELRLLAKSGEQCGAFENPNKPGFAGRMINCENGFKCFDSEGEVSWNGSGVCKEYEFAVNDSMLESYDYSDDSYDEDVYNDINTRGEVYTNTENTEYDQSVEDFESETRSCQNSRSALVQFKTENFFIEWAPACDGDTPELFKSVQSGYDSQKDVFEFFKWCVDTTSGKRWNRVTLASLFDDSTCE